MEKKYKIELTEKQLDVMQEALESFSRGICGQLDYSIFTKSLKWRLKKDNSDYGKNSREIDQAINTIKRLVFELEPNSSYGIGMSKNITPNCEKPIPEADIAYEMYKMINYKWQQDSKKNGTKTGWTVHDSPPLIYSDQPLMVVEDITDSDIVDKKIESIIS